MLKKIFIILILGIMVFSVMPMDAFCNDDHSSPEHHHGVVECHHSCCSVITDSQPVASYFSDTSSQYLPTFSFLYEGPSLDQSNPPPIYSA
tara:strand:+ start:584 stop:856 length:273 start_codon:yes stop_codon:yes gene_type:complete